MSIQGDIVTALAGIAGDRVYPDAAPQDASMPFVIYRRVVKDPLMTLAGYAGSTRSSYLFESWATTKAESDAVSAAVVAAIEAAVAITTKYREPVSAEEYEPQVDSFMEPVQFSFWHS